MGGRRMILNFTFSGIVPPVTSVAPFHAPSPPLKPIEPAASPTFASNERVTGASAGCSRQIHMLQNAGTAGEWVAPCSI
jgi:hypothetical protein